MRFREDCRVHGAGPLESDSRPGSAAPCRRFYALAPARWKRFARPAQLGGCRAPPRCRRRGAGARTGSRSTRGSPGRRSTASSASERTPPKSSRLVSRRESLSSRRIASCPAGASAVNGRSFASSGGTPNSSTSSAWRSALASVGALARKASARAPGSSRRAAMRSAPAGPTMRAAAAVKTAQVRGVRSAARARAAGAAPAARDPQPVPQHAGRRREAREAQERPAVERRERRHRLRCRAPLMPAGLAPPAPKRCAARSRRS